MATQNKTSTIAKDNKSVKETKREFTRIVQAAKPCMRIFACDNKNHIARAVLKTKNAAYIANLSLASKDGEKHLRLIVVLNRKDSLPLSLQQAFLRFQNHTNFGMTFVTFDGEHHTFQVRAQSPLPCSHLTQFAITMIVTAVKKILDDDNFTQFLN